MQNVFVYGTLKTGHGNHRRLGTSPAYLGPCKIKGRMYSLGPFPAIALKDVSDDEVVHGEVYAVSDSTLADLDRLEGHPSFYKREEIATDYGTAWVYAMDHYTRLKDMAVIKTGVWER